MTAVALIPAAGLSRRMGFDKILQKLDGIPLLVRSLRRLQESEAFSDFIVAVHPGSEQEIGSDILAPFGLAGSVRVVSGGVTRTHSVWNALEAVRSTPDLVAVHDAARPFVSTEAVRASLDAAREYGGAVVATRVIPTIKVADERDCVEATPGRTRLWAAATPQSFRYRDFLAAYRRFWASGDDPASLTDDAQLLERAGGTVKLVEGNPENIKITTSLDWRIAELLCSPSPPNKQH